MFFTEKVITKTIVTYPIRDCPWCGLEPDVIVEYCEVDEGTITVSVQCVNDECFIGAATYSPNLYKQYAELNVYLRRGLEMCIVNWNKNPQNKTYTSSLEVCYEDLIDDIRENRY